MKRFIMVLLLICLVITPVFGSGQAVDQDGLTGRLPTPIIPGPTLIPELLLPDLLIEINSVSMKAIPIYRLKTGPALYPRHTYTTSEAQKAHNISYGWTDDGIVTYISPVAIPGYVALYRCTFNNYLTILTTIPGTAAAQGYDVTGIVGFVSSTIPPGAGEQVVYRSVRTSSNYLGMDFYYRTVAGLATGYMYVEPKFKGWSTAKTVQEIVISPVGASQTGNAYLSLNWTSMLSSGVNEVLYSTDNGATYTSIVKNLPNNTTNTYSWKMPNITSTTVRVMVKWSASIVSASAAWARTAKFSITKDPGFSLYIPLIPSIPLFDFVPASPTNLVLEPGASTTHEIKLFWQDNANNETGFKIERKSGAGAFAQIGVALANAASYSDLTVAEGTEYTYRVKASGSITDSGYTDSASATYHDPLFELIPELEFDFLFPDPPTALIATVGSGTDKTASLKWTKPSGTVTGYVIERKTTGDFAAIGSTVADLVYTDSSVDDSATSAVYRVKALNDSFESTPSNEAAVVFAAGTPAIDPELPVGTTVIKLYVGLADYLVNGVMKTMDTSPIVKDGRTLLPVRYIAEPLGAVTAWSPADQKVTITSGGTVIELWIGNNTARVNGVNTYIDPLNANVMPILVPPGRTMLPLRFIGENLGCDVAWDPATKEATLTLEE